MENDGKLSLNQNPISKLSISLIMKFVYSICNSIWHYFLYSKLKVNQFEPCHDKMCLQEFLTRQDTNRPAQPQKLAKVLKFRLQILEILYYLSSKQ